MELQASEVHRCEAYLSSFEGLIGDRRTGRTFRAVIEGIIGAQSLRTSQIARFSPYLSRLEVRG